MEIDKIDEDGIDDTERLVALSTLARQIKAELSRAIIGQSEAIELLLISLFSGGHCLLVGVPGLAKTLMISSMAKVLGLEFRRVQFTPDLMPADITGTEVIQENRETGERGFRFISGPVFTNLLLADEINRSPPKTQAALLEAMQERQVSVAGTIRALPSPFWVLATQNPIEQEGTYPLPEAQLDRFIMQVEIGYPTEEDELAVVMQTTTDESTELATQISREELVDLIRVVRRVPLTAEVARYATWLARHSRPEQVEAVHNKKLADLSIKIRDYVAWGAGPRGSQNLVLAAKARAAMRGQPLVTVDDILAVAAPVLRHRININFRADADGITADDIIATLVEAARRL